MAVVFLLFIALSFVPAKQYSADATLLVRLSQDYIDRPVGDSAMNNVPLDHDQVLKSEASIIESRDLHEAVVKQIGAERLYPELFGEPGRLAAVKQAASGFLTRISAAVTSGDIADKGPEAKPAATPVERAADILGHRLTVTASKDGNIISIEFQHRDPELAASTVNTLVELYLARRREIFARRQSEPVRVQVQDLRRQLTAIETQLDDYRQPNGIVSYATQRDLLLQRQDALRHQMDETEAMVTQLTQREKSLSVALAQTPATVMQTERIDDTGIMQSKDLLNDMKDQEAALRRRGAPADQIAEARRRVENAERMATPKSFRATTTSSLVYEGIRLDQLRTQAELRGAEARRAALQEQLAGTTADLERFAALETRLGELQRDHEVVQESYKTYVKVLDQQVIAESVEEQKTNVRIVQAARIPDAPGRTQFLIMLLGLPFSLVAGLATGIIRDLRRNTFLGPEHLERVLRIPVLVSVPALPARAVGNTLLIADARRPSGNAR
jgi:uncharacterized protein involved in exopolysaccharide biosynthesis